MLTWLFASCFALLQLLLLFTLTFFVLDFFPLQISLLHQFVLAHFRFAWQHRYLFFCLLLTCAHVYHSTDLLLALDSPIWSPLTSMTITTHFLIFCTMYMRHKTSPPHPFGCLFALFLPASLPMHPFATFRTALYPFARILIIFWLTPQNMMSGEISPAIAPKSWPVRP